MSTTCFFSANCAAKPWSNIRPCGESTTTVCSASGFNLSERPAIPSDSTHSNSGSGLSTMPSPPPNGRSSTVLCRSLVKARRSCTSICTMPASRARRMMPWSNGPRKNSGKMVTTSKRIALPLLLFFRQRRIQLQQRLRQFHLDGLAFQVHLSQVTLRERNQQFPILRFDHPCLDNQGGRFARAEHHFL